MSDTLRVGLTFKEFSGQLIYNKTWLLMVVLPLLIFAHFIQTKLDLFSTQLFDKKPDDKIKINYNRLTQNKAIDGGELQLSSGANQMTEAKKVQLIFAKFLSEHHPYLKMMIEFKNTTKEIVYYWGMLFIALAILVSAMYVIDSLI